MSAQPASNRRVHPAWWIIALLPALAAVGVYISRNVEQSETVEVDLTEDMTPIPQFTLEIMEPAVQNQFRTILQRLDVNPRVAEDNGDLGMLFHAYEWRAQAQVMYERARRLEPDNWNWTYYLAVVFAENGRLNESAALFTEVLSQNPNDISALLRLADIHRRLGSDNDAILGYRLVLKQSPGLPQAYCGLGQVYFSQRKLNEAKVELEAALRSAGEEPYGTADYVLGQVLRELGETDEAQKHLELAAQQTGQQPLLDDPLMFEVEQLKTGAIQSLHEGIRISRAGRPHEALPLLQRAVEINPDLAEAWSHLGAAMLKLNRVDEAEPAISRALELNPNFADAVYNLGRIAYQRNDFQTARTQFEKTIHIRHDYTEAHLGLGMVLVKLNRSEQAIEPFKQVMQLRPSDPRPYKHLTTVFIEHQRYGEAVEILKKGVTEVPADLSIANRLAWVLATCSDDAVRDEAEALRIAEFIVQTLRENNSMASRPLDTLAAALAGVGRFVPAIEAAQEALDMAQSRDQFELAEQINRRINLYRDRQPCRESSAGTD